MTAAWAIVERMSSPVSSPDVDRLRQALFATAKRRWGSGVLLGYIAVVTVPVALWLDHPRWVGLSMAAAMSVLGICLRWWSASVRGYADRLLRANDLLSIGQPRDPVLDSDIMAAYPRLVRRVRRKRAKDEPYHTAKGTPSTELLVKRTRESAWWTDKLATKAKKWSYGLACVVAILVPVSFVSAASVEVRAYAMAILAVVLVDTLHLGYQYGRLAKSCEGAFHSLTTLLDRADLTERQALIEVGAYQSARDAGPLIPSWIWWWSRSDEQEAWDVLERPARNDG